ncbi:MAG: Nif3-like dinuclear metal center hexameric protein [Pontiellaceae bacterium]|jgi:putative NIF3 family GTP cyclohydrolase 1 type 2|nr:Nif3-like dinuclear metal center hexameric protein [Pontiellaceae bacterium]
MNIKDIARLLDQEFRVAETADPGMIKYALNDTSRDLVSSAFRERKTGLMFEFADDVDIVFCTTFLTHETVDAVLDKLTGSSLVFTHHPFDYHEDERGMSAVSDELVQRLRKHGVAVYAIHAPLDVGLKISVSQSLASRLSLFEPKPFCATLGGHLGVYGRMATDTVADIALSLGTALGLGTVDLFDNGGPVGLTAVVAGGGDQLDIMKEAQELGCTTYITGTAVHRWELMTNANQEFRDYARESGINLLGGTHYNTEKCAVRDVATLLNEQGIKAEFLEDPVLSKYEEGNFKMESS